MASGGVRKPKLVDLFCKAGGASMGYVRAGFDVVGVDIEPQPNYPFQFVQADALEFSLDGFDAIHASPPCQEDLQGMKAANRALGRDYKHRSLTVETRARLIAAGVPYAIEQPQQGAKLLAPVRLCGSSFGLPIRRHRMFESNHLLMVPACEHDREREAKYWTGYGVWGKEAEATNGGQRVRKLSKVVQVYGNGGDRELWAKALDIDWMTADELAQAIPPAYTEHIGRQLLQAMGY